MEKPFSEAEDKVSMNNELNDKVIDALQHALISIGAEVLKMQHKGKLHISQKSNHSADVVTDGDHTAQRLLQETINKLCPNDSILGEENLAVRKDASRVWILDPVDGTNNYRRKSPDFGISAGMVENGIPMLGIIAFPAQNTMLSAVRGKGAFLNGKRITLAPQTELSQAVVGYDLPYGGRDETGREYLVPLTTSSQYVRMWGSYTRNFLEMMHGYSDALVHPAVTPYDIAAVLAIAHEAGCSVEGLGGPIDLTNEHIGLIIANSPELLRQIKDVLPK